MPGDPKQCREHAAGCRKLAANAEGELRERLLTLAETFERLAAEHESAQAIGQAHRLQEVGVASVGALLLSLSVARWAHGRSSLWTMN